MSSEQRDTGRASSPARCLIPHLVCGRYDTDCTTTIGDQTCPYCPADPHSCVVATLAEHVDPYKAFKVGYGMGHSVGAQRQRLR